MLLTATLIASTLSIATSILTARHRWLAVLWLTLATNVAWVWVEIATMMELERPLNYAPCVLPTVIAGAGAIVGLWRWFRSSSKG